MGRNKSKKKNENNITKISRKKDRKKNQSNVVRSASIIYI
jgi:hypothetical protein